MSILNIHFFCSYFCISAPFKVSKEAIIQRAALIRLFIVFCFWTLNVETYLQPWTKFNSKTMIIE